MMSLSTPYGAQKEAAIMFSFLGLPEAFGFNDLALLALCAFGGLVVGWAFATENHEQRSLWVRMRAPCALTGAALGAIGAFALIEAIALLA
jgi:hypothetical protein